MAPNPEHLQGALALVLKLPAIDRLKLVEQVISSVDQICWLKQKPTATRI